MEVWACLTRARDRLDGAAAAEEIVGNENLGGQAHELLPVSGREKASERAARRVHTLEVNDGIGEVLIVGVGDPPVNLSVGLAENARERLRGHPFDRGVRQERSHRRQVGEHAPDIGRREKDRGTHIGWLLVAVRDERSHEAKGFLVRLERSNRYRLTADGRRLAVFFAKTYARVVTPSLAELDPALLAEIAARSPLARSWRSFEQALDDRLRDAALAA